jgi:hypothetical protein
MCIEAECAGEVRPGYTRFNACTKTYILVVKPSYPHRHLYLCINMFLEYSFDSFCILVLLIVLLKNLMVAQLFKKFSTFIESQGSLSCSGEPSTGHYPEQVE